MKSRLLEFIVIFQISVCPVNLSLIFNHRIRRDDGGYLDNSGGPVAGGPKNHITPTDNKANNGKPSETSDNLRCRYHDKESYPVRGRAKNHAAVHHEKQEKTYYDSVIKLPGNNQFTEFLNSFQKNYDISESLERLNIFKKNTDIISNLNSQRSSPLEAVFGQTKYSDLDFSEFKQKLAGTLPNCDKVQTIHATKRMKMLSNSCPSFDWNDLGVVPTVRMQKECGSCYAMSSVDLLASRKSIDDRSWNRSVSLSPQYILDCFKEPAAIGCTGGRPKKVMEKLSSCSGCKVPLESCYPYEDAKNTCDRNVPCSQAPTIEVKYSELVDVSGPDEKDIMAAILNFGPAIAIVGLTEAWQFYNGSGIIVSNQCQKPGDHAVLVTGYNYQSKIPYYTIKNSWGTDWGDKGYVRIEAGKNVCDIAKSVLLICSKNCDSTTTAQSLVQKSNNPKCTVRNIK